MSVFNPKIYPPEIRDIFFREYYYERVQRGRRPQAAEIVAAGCASVAMRWTDTGVAVLGEELYARECIAPEPPTTIDVENDDPQTTMLNRAVVAQTTRGT